MERVLPVVAEIAGRFRSEPYLRVHYAKAPEDMPGTWRRYYERWRETTREKMDPRLLDLLPALARLVPPPPLSTKRDTRPSPNPSYSSISEAATPTGSSSPVRRPMSACWQRFWAQSITAIVSFS